MCLKRRLCEHDIEGIVAKHKASSYLPDGESSSFREGWDRAYARRLATGADSVKRSA